MLSSMLVEKIRVTYLKTRYVHYPFDTGSHDGHIGDAVTLSSLLCRVIRVVPVSKRLTLLFKSANLV